MLRAAATPKPDAHSPQSAEQFCRPDARPCQPRCVLPSLRQSYSPAAERVVGCPFRARRFHPASDGPGLPPPTRRGFPRTTVFAAATPSSCASPPVGASIPTSQALCEALALPRLWGVPLVFLALATSLRAHRYSGAPKPGGGAGPGRGRSARKVSASCTSSSPRARESLRNFVFRASKSALVSARARSHTHTHTFTHIITRLHTHTSTHPLTSHIATD